jgi:hypothetical protein
MKINSYNRRLTTTSHLHNGKQSLEFSFVFAAPLLHEETCFQQMGSSVVEGTSQAILGSSDQWNLRASQSLFLNSEKIPALLYRGKTPRVQAPLWFSTCSPSVLASATDLKSQRPFSYTKGAVSNYLIKEKRRFTFKALELVLSKPPCPSCLYNFTRNKNKGRKSL